MNYKSQDIYYEPETFVSGNAIITVRRPILSEEEREKRMNAIKEAAAALLIKAEQKKKANLFLKNAYHINNHFDQ